MNPERWQQIKVALHQALELEPEPRRVYLDSLTAEDGDLGAELQSLLAAHDQAGSAFLNVPAAALEILDNVESPDPWVGKRIGPYQLIEEVGSGGMGQVYRASRADDEYQKQVAIKLIRTGQDSAPVVQRFKNERQILAGFEHPNIARLLDGGTTAEGLPYFAMEFVQGEPLDRFCDRRKLDTTARLRLFLQVCDVVQYAHQRLIIHRDLKPNNILVGADGAPKLLDFGIAKILESGQTAKSTKETLSVYRMLTPHYASPEQITGEAITTASDVYSLGIILYELLTGRSFQAVSGSAAEPRKPSVAVRRRDAGLADSGAREAAAEQDPSTLRDGSPQKLSRRLRGDLDNIVLMALRADPARRYRSVEQFAEDLRRHLSSHPVIARKDTLRYRAAKFAVRYAVGIAATAVVGTAMVVGLLITMREARIAQEQRERAEHRFGDVRKLAHSLIFDINDSMQNISGSSQARHLILRTGLQYLDSLSREAAGDPSLQEELAAAYERLGDVQGRALEANEGDYAGAAASYRQSLALRQSIVAGQPGNTQVRRELIVNNGKLSDLMWSSGKPADALLYSEATLGNSRLLVRGDPNNRQYQMLLASSLLDNGFKRFKIQGDTVHALENGRQAIASLQSLRAADSGDLHVGRTLALAYSRTAEILSHAEVTYEEALALDEAARKLMQSLVERAPTNVDFTHLKAFSDHDTAGVLIKMGAFARAEADEAAALTEFKALSAADPNIAEYHVDVALALANMAVILNQRGLTGLAITDLQEALQEYAHDASTGATVNVYFRSSKAIQQQRLAEVYSSLASNRQLDAAHRIQYWKSAKQWYEKTLETLYGLRASSHEAIESAAQIARRIQVCEAGLAALGYRG